MVVITCVHVRYFCFRSGSPVLRSSLSLHYVCPSKTFSCLCAQRVLLADLLLLCLCVCVRHNRLSTQRVNENVWIEWEKTAHACVLDVRGRIDLVHAHTNFLNAAVCVRRPTELLSRISASARTHMPARIRCKYNMAAASHFSLSRSRPSAAAKSTLTERCCFM